MVAQGPMSEALLTAMPFCVKGWDNDQKASQSETSLAPRYGIRPSSTEKSEEVVRHEALEQMIKARDLSFLSFGSLQPGCFVLPLACLSPIRSPRNLCLASGSSLILVCLAAQ